jgi:hypothetical protein
MRTSSSALGARAPRHRSLDSKASESRPVPMLAHGTASRAVGGRPAHPTLDGPTVIAMSCAAGSTWPLPFQDALIAVAVTFVIAAGRDGLRDQSSGSRLMNGCRWTASTLTDEHWRWSDTCGSGRGRSVERERFLSVKRAFPFGIHGRRRPGRTAPSTAVPRGLLTRKRSQVQILSRPRHPP